MESIDIKLRMDEIMRLERVTVSGEQIAFCACTRANSRLQSLGSVTSRHFLTCIRCKAGVSHLIFP